MQLKLFRWNFEGTKRGILGGINRETAYDDCKKYPRKKYTKR